MLVCSYAYTAIFNTLKLSAFIPLKNRLDNLDLTLLDNLDWTLLDNLDLTLLDNLDLTLLDNLDLTLLKV